MKTRGADLLSSCALQVHRLNEFRGHPNRYGHFTYGQLSFFSNQKKPMRFVGAALLCMRVCAFSPQVIPISNKDAMKAVSDWLESGAPEERQTGLRRSLGVLECASSPNFACIALVVNRKITTVSAIERIPILDRKLPILVLWTIESGDRESGTILMRALVKMTKSRLVISRELHPRWRVAYTYFSSAASPPYKWPD